MALCEAEQLLFDLGVSSPDEIDLEALAFDQGATVRYRSLQGCEARILGNESNAIITVDNRAHPGRVRFSLAHELGHWRWHRGRSLMCRKEDIGNPRHSPVSPERIADAYAADLLLPSYLFVPRATQLARVGIETLEQLAREFRCSLTATAIRLVERGPEPALLVCSGRHGRRWFNRPRSIPERWFPKKEIDPDTFAYDLLVGGRQRFLSGVMDAEAWFDQEEARDFEITEESLKISDDEVLSFLVINDGEMLDDRGGSES